MQDVAFDTIHFGMKPKAIIKELVKQQKEKVKAKQAERNSDKALKFLLESNRDFKKPLKRKILKIDFLIKLIFDDFNRLNKVTFTRKPFSFSHCIQEAEITIGLLAESYIHDKPEEILEPAQILKYYRDLVSIHHLIRLRKKDVLPITEWSDVGRVGRKAEILCNEHLTGNRRYTVKLVKYIHPPEEEEEQNKDSSSLIERVFNRDWH